MTGRQPRVAHCVGLLFPRPGRRHGGLCARPPVRARQAVGRRLCRRGDRRAVSAPYDWEGVRCSRYPSNWADIREYAPSRPRAGLSKFQELVLENRPDIFHLHSWTSGAGLEHLLAGRAARHSLRGHHACAVGAVHARHHAAARPHRPATAGSRRSAARSAGRSSAACRRRSPTRCRGCRGCRSRAARPPRCVSRAVTLLSARSRVVVQAHELRQMADLSEKIVAPSGWVHDGLLANGIAAEKLTVSRQGVTLAWSRGRAHAARGPRRRSSRSASSAGWSTTRARIS